MYEAAPERLRGPPLPPGHLGRHPRHPWLPGGNDAKLAQKLGQLQPRDSNHATRWHRLLISIKILSLCKHRNACANLHLLWQPDTFSGCQGGFIWDYKDQGLVAISGGSGVRRRPPPLTIPSRRVHKSIANLEQPHLPFTAFCEHLPSTTL